VASTTLSPAQRSLRARIGAFALHATGGTSTAAGTRAFLDRFEREVRAAAAARCEALTPEEAARRIRSARRAHFAKLALASSRARSKRRAAPDDQRPGTATEARGDRRELPPAA
jgi:hypothetical protein